MTARGGLSENSLPWPIEPRLSRETGMLTFFTTAKPFEGHNGIIQRNALKSWKLLDRDVEVILFGDEKGAAEACQDLRLRHVPQVARHESGFKYIGRIFDDAQEKAQHDIVCYVNCDIILTSDL